MNTRVITLALLALVFQATASQAQTPAPERIWQDKCSRCHGAASHFASQSLDLAEDVPVLRHDRRRLEAFLTGHGRLSPEEISAVSRMLAEALVKPAGN